MKKARVRFSSAKNSFHVDERLGWSIFKYWKTVKSTTWDHPAREFLTYGDAYAFAVKCTTDVEIQHKNNEYDPV